ncbi:MAG: hypothetical protein PHV02_18390 [Rhodocyclaceae bacterium]|jgi:hypothetical protein|nr:hypothetical protein [Rhodocyclaceae bacterium]
MPENEKATDLVPSSANLPISESDNGNIETWLATASRDELASRLRDTYTGKIKLIEAHNDFDALSTWLSGYENNSIETFRAFKLEAEKLLI